MSINTKDPTSHRLDAARGMDVSPPSDMPTIVRARGASSSRSSPTAKAFAVAE